jgi:hypothetical protein
MTDYQQILLCVDLLSLELHQVSFHLVLILHHLHLQILTLLEQLSLLEQLLLLLVFLLNHHCLHQS